MSTFPEISIAPDQLPLTISAAADKLRNGSLTSVALTQAVMARADKLDPLLGTYITRTDEAALAAAATADEELTHGNDKGLLHGIPLGIKDIIAVDGTTTTAQSLILRPEFSDQGDAVVVARLKAAGAVITGKATTMEYAIGTPDPSKGFPTPRNPFDTDRWPGGSSSGTGSGVAAGMFLGGLGTDTGGSVRLPAGWCGISGMKQTFGRVPKSGCVPLGYSYDNIGPMTRSARDAAAMLAIMAGHDESDACSIDRPVDDYVGALTGSVEGLRIGVDLGFLSWPTCDPDVAALYSAAIGELRALGGKVTEITLPYWSELTTATMAGLQAEAFAYHRADLQQRWTDYGRGTRTAIGAAMLATAGDYVQAQRVRRVGVRAVAELLQSYDLLVTPTTLVPAPKVDDLDFASLIDSILTPYWNAVGLQLTAAPLQEALVFRAADAFQQVTDHHLAESALVIKEMQA